MIKNAVKNSNGLKINNSLEGETLETKIERIVNNNEPIKDGAPILYTERKEGIRPSTNIRTDRFEVAIEAADKVAASYKARRENKADVKAVMEVNKEITGGESIHGETSVKQGT